MSPSPRTRHGPCGQAARETDCENFILNPAYLSQKFVRPCYRDVNRDNQGAGLGDGSEQQLAEAMIRLYGRDAQSVAMGHAETHADMGDSVKSERWQRIADAIADLRMHESRSAG